MILVIFAGDYLIAEYKDNHTKLIRSAADRFDNIVMEKSICYYNGSYGYINF